MISKLKLIRENKGVTQKELSDKTGIVMKTIQAYEQGVVKPENYALGKAVKIAQVLECEVEDLL